jgi:hypothetical protein
VVYLALNMRGEALEWMERSARERDYFFPAMMMVMDNFDFAWVEAIKEEPRFKALQKKVKIG